MKSHARVVVIGGGIAGCSTLYHLTQEGWTDVVLVERDELTSGSTWHAAAQVTNFGAVQTMVGLKSHSIKLYKELSTDPDFPFAYHITGGARLAHTQDHLDGYHHFVSMANGMDVDFEVLDAAETVKRHPLIDPTDLAGSLWDPLDGYIDPNGITQALARKAKAAGAEVYRFNPVESISKNPSGEWVVHTKDGDITCEKVVNATGYRVNEVGNMLGVVHPVMSMEHMFFLTDSIPEIEALDFQVPLIRCPKDDFYSRPEKKGLLVGIYEQGCKTFGMQGIDPSFTMQLCPNDLDRCLDNMERVFERLPVLADAGIHTIINGPITYTPDGLPLVGPIPGVKNAYACLGLRAGIGEGGGHGKMLAQIMVHGQAEFDTWCLDPRRLTSHCTVEYTAKKAIEDYQNEFRFHMPHEHRPAGRPAKLSPLYPVLKERGAEFGVVNGWERALFIKPSDDFQDEHSFHFTPTQAIVKQEIETLTTTGSMIEVSGFARFDIQGEGTAQWLDSLTISRLPKVGRVSLAYTVNDNGSVCSEWTLARLSEDHFWIGTAAAAEWHDRDWLMDRLPNTGITVTNLTSNMTTLVLAGPVAREWLSRCSPNEDWSATALPWLSVGQRHIGQWPVTVMAISYSGELSYELHVPNEALVQVFLALEAVGKSLGTGLSGLYAVESMRLEKGYRHWKADLMNEFNPYESGLDRFIQLDKPTFEGKDALTTASTTPHTRTFVVLNVDCDTAAPHAGDSIRVDGRVVGTITSAGRGLRINQTIAYGFIQPDLSAIGTAVTVDIVGTAHAATIAPECQYDPDNTLQRSA